MQASTLVLGYVISVFGSFITHFCVLGLRKIVDKDPKFQNRDNEPFYCPPWISRLHGIMECTLFTTCVWLRPEGIAVWLAFKAIQRVKIHEQEDHRHIPASNIYLIGTALNLAFGITGGLVITGKLLLK
jgi:hypothetical protein